MLEVCTIVTSRNGVLLFSSTAAAERYLEGTDVREGEYGIAVDANGQHYSIMSDGFDQVILLPEHGSGPDLATFRDLLLEFLEARMHGNICDASLQELITAASKSFDA